MVSVVIPTYNEGDVVGELLERLAGVRHRLGGALEVIVVDDRSSDGTAEAAEQVLQRQRLGRVIRREGPRDLAGAVWDGIQASRGDSIGVMDADLSHPPELLPVLVEAVDAGRQIAVASRYCPGGGIRHWPWSRRLLSQIGNGLARPLVSVRDATSGYFVVSRQALRGVRLQPRGFKILLELLVRGSLSSVQEVPYVFMDRRSGASKLSRKVLWRYAAQLSRLYGYRLRHG